MLRFIWKCFIFLLFGAIGLWSVKWFWFSNVELMLWNMLWSQLGTAYGSSAVSLSDVLQSSLFEKSAIGFLAGAVIIPYVLRRLFK